MDFGHRSLCLLILHDRETARHTDGTGDNAMNASKDEFIGGNHFVRYSKYAQAWIRTRPSDVRSGVVETLTPRTAYDDDLTPLLIEISSSDENSRVRFLRSRGRTAVAGPAASKLTEAEMKPTIAF